MRDRASSQDRKEKLAFISGTFFGRMGETVNDEEETLETLSGPLWMKYRMNPVTEETENLEPVRKFGDGYYLKNPSDNVRQDEKFFRFSEGQWLPNFKPVEIGAENFQQLINLRYCDGHLETVNGYAPVLYESLPDSPAVRSGIYFISAITAYGNGGSYTLVSAENGLVYERIAGVPGVSDFEDEPIWNGYRWGRFSKAPGGNISYCTGLHSCIYAGHEMRVGGVFSYSPVIFTGTCTFNAADGETYLTDTVTSSGTDFLNLGFKAGQLIDIAGGSNSGKRFVIQKIDGGTMGISGDAGAVNSTGTATLEAKQSEYNVVDYSEAMNTVFIDTETGDPGLSSQHFLIMTVRPVKGFRFYLSDANTNGGTLSAEVWNGIFFQAVSGLNDGTSALASEGTVSFGSTVGTAKPKHFEGLYLYAYRFKITGGSVPNHVVRMITADAPFQPIADLWDSVYRQPVGFWVYKQKKDNFEDYTLEINEEEYGYSAEINGLGTDDYILIAFDEPMTAVQVVMFSDQINLTDDTHLHHAYWTGADWKYTSYMPGVNPPENTSFSDGTISEKSYKTFSRTGFLHWLPQPDEQPRTYMGITGYFYRLTATRTVTGEISVVVPESSFFAGGNYINTGSTLLNKYGFKPGDSIVVSGSASNNTVFTVKEILSLNHADYDDPICRVYIEADTPVTDETGAEDVRFSKENKSVSVNTVRGVPAQKIVKRFNFPVLYNDMILLCDYEEGNERNRIDYCEPHAPEIWNGEMSSNDGLQSLYVGGTDPLTAGVEIYNRFGSSVFSMCLLFKKNETYVLAGTSPKDFKVLPVSYNVGCPAPMSLCVAEMGYEMAEEANRNVAFWCSYSGPYIFDGGIISPLRGVEHYFDAARLPLDLIPEICGWYDETYKEYNIVVPQFESGASATDEKKAWLCFSLMYKKWFRKSLYTGSVYTADDYYPLCAFPVRSFSGRQYVYAGLSNGRAVVLEAGGQWQFAPSWKPDTAYSAGSFVIYEGKQWVCIYQVDAGVAPGTAGHWEESDIYYSAITGYFYPYSPFQTARIRRMTLTAMGDIYDSGTGEICVEDFDTGTVSRTQTYIALLVGKKDTPNEWEFYRLIQNVNTVGNSFVFVFRFRTVISENKIQLIGWGYIAEPGRELTDTK